MTPLPRVPGRVEEVRATRALVLAPHPDDEVVGCGGLLRRLAASGCEVRVLLLTDGSGGTEEVADRETYRARRRAEVAAAGAALGLAGAEHVDLPDGALAEHRPAAAAAIRRALLALRPDLILVPSPVERTADHRAAFAALHEVLTAVRPGDELAAAIGAATVLLYEVNHPGDPDLLVDVGSEVPAIEAAMACYASQEERHPYLAAARGLRQWRTLSLGPEVRAAEAYRRLALADFVTRGHAALIEEIGGRADLLVVREGPRLSVIVRTKDRPDLLVQALGSLAASRYGALEVVLVNDGGSSPAVPDDFPLALVRVDLERNRGRAAAANAGVAAATGDYVSFLDDDDLVEREHFATLAGLVGGAGVRVAYTDAAVGIYEPDAVEGWRCAERRLPYSRDFDADLLLVDNYIPFNTLAIERGLLREVGPCDESLPFFEDWELLIRLAQRTAFLHLARVTCEYRHFRGGAHHVFGERPSERADFLAVKARVLARHTGLLTPERLARIVDRLRAETVAAGEAAHAAEVARRAEEERYHRVNGALAARETESAALQLDRERLAAELGEQHAALARQGVELERLYGEEQRLHGDQQRLAATAAEQAAQLARTDAEIERLETLRRAMESTRAWRLHAWWQRRRR